MSQPRSATEGVQVIARIHLIVHVTRDVLWQQLGPIGRVGGSSSSRLSRCIKSTASNDWDDDGKEQQAQTTKCPGRTRPSMQVRRQWGSLCILLQASQVLTTGTWVSIVLHSSMVRQYGSTDVRRNVCIGCVVNCRPLPRHCDLASDGMGFGGSSGRNHQGAARRSRSRRHRVTYGHCPLEIRIQQQEPVEQPRSIAFASVHHH